VNWPLHPSAPSEAEVRAMRDLVYSIPSTDGNWEACKDAWMAPENVEWLLRECAKVKATVP
jgi:hypothetical protein